MPNINVIHCEYLKNTYLFLGIWKIIKARFWIVHFCDIQIPAVFAFLIEVSVYTIFKGLSLNDLSGIV